MVRMDVHSNWTNSPPPLVLVTTSCVSLWNSKRVVSYVDISYCCLKTMCWTALKNICCSKNDYWIFVEQKRYGYWLCQLLTLIVKKLFTFIKRRKTTFAADMAATNEKQQNVWAAWKFPLKIEICFMILSPDLQPAWRFISSCRGLRPRASALL